jgi:ABC-type branched-subunit amino acid transport system ATPase component
MLTIRGVNQYYSGSHILRDVSLDVPPGQCTALLGRNGVGKTTLLKCIIGLLPIRSGAIEFDGRSIAELPPYARAKLGIAYVPQVGIINPGEMSPANSIEIAIWTAVGGRGTLVGPVFGAAAVNLGKSWFTQALPEYWLFALGLVFVVVTFYFPRGIAALWRRRPAWR